MRNHEILEITQISLFFFSLLAQNKLKMFKSTL